VQRAARGSEYALEERPTPGGSLLRPPENCRCITHADRFSMLVDGASYFDAFRRAAERAQRSILILAWDFDSRTPVAWDERRATLRLGEFLNSLARRRRRLEVRVLDWDYPLLYGLELRPLPSSASAETAPSGARATTVLTVGGLQHQKMVIDDRVAFVGASTSPAAVDTPAHEPAGRGGSGRTSLPALPDVMAMLDGPAARARGRRSPSLGAATGDDSAESRWRLTPASGTSRTSRTCDWGGLHGARGDGAPGAGGRRLYRHDPRAPGAMSTWRTSTSRRHDRRAHGAAAERDGPTSSSSPVLSGWLEAHHALAARASSTAVGRRHRRFRLLSPVRPSPKACVTCTRRSRSWTTSGSASAPPT
jgi:hypothetical protein